MQSKDIDRVLSSHPGIQYTYPQDVSGMFQFEIRGDTYIIEWHTDCSTLHIGGKKFLKTEQLFKTVELVGLLPGKMSLIFYDANNNVVYTLPVI